MEFSAESLIPTISSLPKGSWFQASESGPSSVSLKLGVSDEAISSPDENGVFVLNNIEQNELEDAPLLRQLLSCVCEKRLGTPMLPHMSVLEGNAAFGARQHRLLKFISQHELGGVRAEGGKVTGFRLNQSELKTVLCKVNYENMFGVLRTIAYHDKGLQVGRGFSHLMSVCEFLGDFAAGEAMSDSPAEALAEQVLNCPSSMRFMFNALFAWQVLAG